MKRQNRQAPMKGESCLGSHEDRKGQLSGILQNVQIVFVQDAGSGTGAQSLGRHAVCAARWRNDRQGIPCALAPGCWRPASASATTEPLAVDYVRLQGTGEFGKALSHYRSAITAIPGAKPRIFRRLIENGTWLDTIQKDQTGHRTRSIDVLVTRESSDDDNGKKSGAEELTVEILLVEIETPESDATPGSSKKEPRETTSTTPP